MANPLIQTPLKATDFGVFKVYYRFNQNYQHIHMYNDHLNLTKHSYVNKLQQELRFPQINIISWKLKY